ncbi:MAG: hypothetical protein ABFS39_00870 [Pseudomonadota bacterium]
MKQLFMILGLLLPVSIATVQAAGEWSFPDDDLKARVAAVSDGELTLLDTAPERPEHHHRNQPARWLGQLGDQPPSRTHQVTDHQAATGKSRIIAANVRPDCLGQLVQGPPLYRIRFSTGRFLKCRKNLRY